MIKIKMSKWNDSTRQYDEYTSSSNQGKPWTETTAKAMAGKLAWDYPGCKISIIRYESIAVDSTIFDSSDEEPEEEQSTPKRRRRKK